MGELGVVGDVQCFAHVGTIEVRKDRIEGWVGQLRDVSHIAATDFLNGSIHTRQVRALVRRIENAFLLAGNKAMR